MEEQNLKTKNWVTNVLASIGLIAVLSFTVWGSVQLIKLSPSLYSTLSATVVDIKSIFIPNTSDNTPNIEDKKETDGTTKKVTSTEGKETESLTQFSGSSDTITVSDPNGFVDLSVQILETGTIDKTTNEFTATSSVSTYDRVAVKFEVKNIGTKSSDNWTFNAVLPTYPLHIYHSKGQQILGPGDRIVFTIGFDSMENKEEGIVTINIDPTGSLNESLKTNNIVKTTISVVTQ